MNIKIKACLSDERVPPLVSFLHRLSLLPGHLAPGSGEEHISSHFSWCSAKPHDHLPYQSINIICFQNFISGCLKSYHSPLRSARAKTTWRDMRLLQGRDFRPSQLLQTLNQVSVILNDISSAQKQWLEFPLFQIPHLELPVRVDQVCSPDGSPDDNYDDHLVGFLIIDH